ncbi:MAG: porin [Polyangiaceae bacterium]|nr:porin [Polyangiaceae bacterium]
MSPATQRVWSLAALTGVLAVSIAPRVLAQTAAEPEPLSPTDELNVTFGGYVEAFYQWNLNDPDNRMTNFRGFDNRHDTFTLSNVALDGQMTYGPAQARITLQVGHTPDTYYLAEPFSPGTSGANESSKDLWKYVQQAYAGYEFGVGGGLLVQAGIFLSPIGPESMPVKDSWNWSRSNLFFGLPFYHTGIHATYKATDEWSVRLGLVNGWNSVVDNNPEKSGHVGVIYTKADKLTWTFLYFGGIERNDHVPEGDPWRSTFDTHATWQATDWFALQPHFDVGFEPNDLGVSYWVAEALSARFRIMDWLYLAVREDFFYESAPTDGGVTASRIFWPVDWVASATATAEARLVDHVSFRLEYRHDHAAGDMYFANEVAGDGETAPFVPNARYQDTFALGATAWF